MKSWLKAQKVTTPILYQDQGCAVAEKEGFEPSRRLPQPTPLAGEPLRPLGYFSKPDLAEREGFEPPVPCGITGFQDQRLKPLGHLSLQPALISIHHIAPNVKTIQCFLTFRPKFARRRLRKFSPGCIDISGKTPIIELLYRDSLAQSAEHLTFNQGVRGSNPR